MAGLVTTGFVVKTAEEILDSLRARVLAEIDPALDVSTSSPFGQFLGIVADEIAQVWELAAAVNAGQSPEDATHFSLTNVAALTGTVREAATPSQVTLTLSLEAATTVPAGSVVAVAGNPTVRFRTLVAVTSVLADDYDVAAECEDTGPIAANGGTLTIIVTPVAGWTAVTNVNAADQGTDIETDEALRIRRELELRAQGTSPLDALRADLLELDGIDQAVVFENVSNTVVDGMPPHSIEAVVFDDPMIANALIAGLLWANKAAGIQAYGTTVTSVEDSAGYAHNVGFTRASQVLVYLDFDVAVDEDIYPADGDDQVAAVVEAFGEANYAIGGDVILRRLEAAIFAGVAGIVDITATRAGTAPDPAGTSNLAIGRREIARLAASRIVVASTPAVDL